jgi:hypothetical protein
MSLPLNNLQRFFHRNGACRAGHAIGFLFVLKSLLLDALERKGITVEEG